MFNELIFIVTLLGSLAFIFICSHLDRWWLYAAIVTNLILISTFGAKLILIFEVETNVGNIFYAALFLAAQFLVEYHSKKAARLSIWIGAILLVYFILMGQLTLHYVGLPETGSVNQAIDTLFRVVPRISFASIVGYLVSQNLNVWLYALLREKHGAKFLWLRAILSNVTGQFIDSILFFLLAFYGTLPGTVVFQSLTAGFLIKIFVGFLGIPLLYARVLTSARNGGSETSRPVTTVKTITRTKLPELFVAGYRENDTLSLKFLYTFLIVAPVLGVMAFSYIQIRNNLTEALFKERRSQVLTASVIIKERLDRLVDIGTALAAKNQVQIMVRRAKWQEAARYLEYVPQDFPFIERIFLTDAAGTLMADVPEISEVHGKNFAFRDWYKGVSKDWTPYVSEIYRRQASPQYNVFSIAIPIAEEGTILGILVLQIKLDTVFAWSKDIVVNGGRSVSLVDQHGHLAGNPHRGAQEDIVDYANVPIVQKVLRGDRGIDIGANHITKVPQLAAYEPIPGYGWGAIAEQSLGTVFTERDTNVRFVLIVFGILLFVLILAIFTALRAFATLRHAAITAHEQARLEAILLSIGEGIVVINERGNILLVNKVFEELFGWKRDEILGKRMADIIPCQDESGAAIPTEQRTSSRALATKKTTSIPPGLYYVRKNKTRFPVSGIVTTIAANGNLIGAVEVFRDISKEKEIEKLRMDFLSLASHQLRTPLSGTKWLIETMRREIIGTMNERQQYYIKQIYTLNERMIKLVFDMLNVLRLENETILLKKEPVSVPVLYLDLTTAMAAAAQAKNITLRNAFKERKPVIIESDPQILKNILENFISNGINYSMPGQEVILDFKEEADMVVFFVKDSGIGIPHDEQKKIFERFYRASNAEEFNLEGTGLGLHIAAMLAGKISATITFESEKNKGSTFYLHVPKKSV